jgi:hypothetical protein
VDAGAGLPVGVEGGSWKPLLTSGGLGRVRRPIDRLVFHHDVEVEHPQTALRQGDLKLVHHWDTRQSFLYDLSSDLGERSDLSRRRPEDTRRLLALLEAHVRQGLSDARVDRLREGAFRERNGAGGQGGREGKTRRSGRRDGPATPEPGPSGR